MKFFISTADANRLYEVGKANKGNGGNKNYYKDSFDLLRCELSEGFLIFQRWNMYCTGIFRIEVTSFDPDVNYSKISDVEDVVNQDFCLAPPTKKFKDKPVSVCVQVRDISERDKEVTYSTPLESQTIRYSTDGTPEGYDKKTSREAVIEGKSVARIYLNPRLLAEALAPYVADYKRLEGYEVMNGYIQVDILSGLSGLSITNKAGEITRVLPIQPPEKTYKNILSKERKEEGQEEETPRQLFKLTYEYINEGGNRKLKTKENMTQEVAGAMCEWLKNREGYTLVDLSVQD